MESILKELEYYIRKSFLLSESQKHELLSEIVTTYDIDRLNSIKNKLKNESEFTVKYLQHIIKDYREINVFELKSKLSNSYIKYLHNEENLNRQMDFDEANLILNSLM